MWQKTVIFKVGNFVKNRIWNCQLYWNWVIFDNFMAILAKETYSYGKLSKIAIKSPTIVDLNKINDSKSDFLDLDK